MREQRDSAGVMRLMCEAPTLQGAGLCLNYAKYENPDGKRVCAHHEVSRFAARARKLGWSEDRTERVLAAKMRARARVAALRMAAAAVRLLTDLDWEVLGDGRSLDDAQEAVDELHRQTKKLERLAAALEKRC